MTQDIRKARHAVPFRVPGPLDLPPEMAMPRIVLNREDAERVVARGLAQADHVIVSPVIPQEVLVPAKKTSGGRRGGKKPGAIAGSPQARKGSSAGGRKSRRGKKSR